MEGQRGLLSFWEWGKNRGEKKRNAAHYKAKFLVKKINSMSNSRLKNKRKVYKKLKHKKERDAFRFGVSPIAIQYEQQKEVHKNSIEQDATLCS